MLFLDDWNKFKNRGYEPFIDYDSPNISFLKMVELLQKKNIKNHFFPIVTLNKDLKGIDPHDPKICNMSDPSLELLQIRTLIMDESINNVWYYFREVVRIGSSGSSEKARYQLHRGSLALYWLLENHIDVYIELPRQKGKTFGIAGYVSRPMAFASSNGTYAFITVNRKLTADFSKYLDGFIKGLPPYMNFRHNFDKCNTEIVTMKRLENQIHLLVCQDNPDDARSVGRGLTIIGDIFDEVNFQTNLDISYPVVKAATSAAKRNAAANNAPYFSVISSTAGDLNTKAGRYGRTLYDASLPFNETFYDLKDIETLNDFVDRNNLARLNYKAKSESKNEVNMAPRRVLVSFGYKALGESDEWYEKKKVEFGYTNEDQAQNELNNKWLKNSSGNVITAEESKKLNDSAMEVIYSEITENNYVINWYVDEEEVIEDLPNRQIIMGVDPSNALGGDFFPFVLLDSDTAETIGTGYYNQTNLTMLINWFVSWFDRFPDNLFMVIENRSQGTALIDAIIYALCKKGINPLEKIYNHIVNESDSDNKQLERYNESFNRLHDLNYFAALKREIGFTTSAGARNSRDKLYSQALRSYLKNSADVCRDARLISEWHTLTSKNGKIEAEAGAHDDMIVALLLAYWFLLYGRNKSRYALDTNRILNKAMSKTLGEEGVEKLKKSQQYSDKISEIEELIRNAKNEDEITLYNRIIEKLRDKTSVYDVDTSLDIDKKLVELSKKEKKEFNYLDAFLKRR